MFKPDFPFATPLAGAAELFNFIIREVKLLPADWSATSATMKEQFASRFWRLLVTALGLSGQADEVQVIGAGLARTGTTSLQAALSTLLGGPVHHFENLVASSSQQAGWTALRDGHGDPTLLRSLVSGYVATVDVPTALHYRALLKEFPKAKVVLTLHPRGADGWYESTMSTIWHIHMNVLNTTWLGKYAFPFRGFHVVGRNVWLDNPFFLTGEEWLQPRVAKRKYERWIASVKRTVPSSRLLVYSVDQGWDPLCKFLKVPIPSTPFPNMNDTRKLRAAAAVLSWMSVLLPPVVLTAFVYLIQAPNRRPRYAGA